jgi:PAS domain-containing protein
MTSTSEDGARGLFDLPADDFATVFEKIPGPCLVMDPSFTIVAVNDACCSATIRERADMIGRHLFEVFPDNPHQSGSDAVENFRASLLTVLKTRQPDHMRIQKYDVWRADSGTYEERYWSAINVPVLGPDGYVKWIIHRDEDVTELVKLRTEFQSNSDDHVGQRLIDQLHETEDRLAAAHDEIAHLRERLNLPPKG